MDTFIKASRKTARLLSEQLDALGALRDPDVTSDLCSQYKLPTLLLISGHSSAAHLLLDRIKRDFMQSDGDFLSYADMADRDRKSSCFPMSHFWTYMNVWVAMAAQRLGRFDISYPAFEFCKRFYHPDRQMVCVTEAYENVNQDTTVDVLSTSHLGLLALYMGDVDLAKNCGEGLLKFMNSQPNKEEQIYLRANAQTGDVITSAPPNMKPFYVIHRDHPKQLYFFIGYYGIFMTKLFQATQDQRFLESAKRILDFALTCHESMVTYSFSHKVAYAAALVAAVTKETKYRRLAIGLGEFLVSIQNDEGFFGSQDFQPIDKYDQSAEIAIWLREVHNELTRIM